MDTITLNRKSNFMLMGRKFKIYIDNELYSEISDGEVKELKIPSGAGELYIRVMNYKSKPIQLVAGNQEIYTIQQNVISTLATIFMVILAGAFFILKFIFERDIPIFFNLCLPFFAVHMFFSTFGRTQVIQLKKTT